jgi:hypothetical protein
LASFQYGLLDNYHDSIIFQLSKKGVTAEKITNEYSMKQRVLTSAAASWFPVAFSGDFAATFLVVASFFPAFLGAGFGGEM